jgi:hypothetical protein
MIRSNLEKLRSPSNNFQEGKETKEQNPTLEFDEMFKLSSKPIDTPNGSTSAFKQDQRKSAQTPNKPDKAKSTGG